MRYLKSLDRAKHGHMLADLKNKALSNPDNTYPVDLCGMCDLATNWSNSSVGVRNDIPASGVVFNTTGRGDDRKAGDKGQKKNVNAKESKQDKKIECWNCGGNHFARDCTKG